MVRPVIRDFMTGLFALLALFGLILMLLLFGEIADLGQHYYTFTVHVTNAGGLSGTSAVTLNGVKVGQVLETNVVPPPGLGANLKIRIKEQVGIPKVAKVAIERSFVGDAGMEFTIPPDAPVTAMNDLIKPGETFEGGAPESTIGRLASAIEKPLSRFSATAENIDKLAGTYNTLGERLNELLEPRTPADLAAGKAPNIRSTIARADLALDNATKFLSDEQLVKDTKSLISRANGVMDNLDKQATRVGDSVDNLAQQAAGALRTTDKAANELAEVLEKAANGNGTVGQLMNNPDLYNNLRDAAQRLDRALADFQLLIQKYRTEGIPLHL